MRWLPAFRQQRLLWCEAVAALPPSASASSLLSPFNLRINVSAEGIDESASWWDDDDEHEEHSAGLRRKSLIGRRSCRAKAASGAGVLDREERKRNSALYVQVRLTPGCTPPVPCMRLRRLLSFSPRPHATAARL